ncbi:trypsin-like peptidase domain-containing protein [Streptomyces sp. NPDC058572]|uniref:VMAP-C domain-containing protein n=1 Tax=Streptomyces sp. NPDC058572 TaxID=3346546 RepID=UPI00365231D2
MSGLTPLSQLQTLLGRCRVRVDGVTKGAGFFVAPGFVLSCAHVAGAVTGKKLPVWWDGREYEAAVLASSDAPSGAARLWPYPDLSILKVADGPAEHPCVWLDGLLPASGTWVTTAGFADTYAPGSERLAELMRRGTMTLDGGRMLELDGEINLGLSGGAVLSHRTGGVCAVIKATRKKDSDMGGLATPVDALRLLDIDVYRTVVREHDRFHAGPGGKEWARLSDQLGDQDGHGCAPPTLSRTEHRQLLGLIADLRDTPSPGPGLLTGSFVVAAGPDTPPPDRYPLIDRRDVFTELAAQMRPEGQQLPYELAFAADLARTAATPGSGDSDVARQLRNRVLIAAGRMELGDEAESRLADPPASGSRSSVIGKLRHSRRERNLYHVMVWRYISENDIVPAATESGAMPLSQAIEHLARLLPEQIDIMGGVGKPGLIELILPLEALDEDFSAWRLWPERSYYTLGRKQHLVVRPLERHEMPALHYAWTQRWQQLEGKAVGESLVCVCGRDRQQQDALDATFNNDPALASLALAGSPRSMPVSQAYEVAIASGVPMMVWRRSAEACPRGNDAVCGIPGRDSCSGDAFYARLCKALATTERDALPEKVRELRNAVLTDPCEDHVGEHVVLLWDDPARQIPRRSLAPALPAEEGCSQ